MSLFAMVLILIAAVTHAAWNYVGKRDRPSSALFLVASVLGGVSMLPVVAHFLGSYAAIPASVWAIAALTGAFQALYFGMLAAAYRSGDLSLVYPLARSVPTLLVTGFALLLGTGHEISRPCLAGIGLIVVGCTVLPMKSLRSFQLKDYLNACCCCAMFAAIGTAGYMALDSAALKSLCALDGKPFSKVEAALIYAPIEVLSTVCWLGVYVLNNGAERSQLKTVLATTKLRALLMGLAIYGAYTLVLVAMNYAEHVSYVMAFRQLSIPLGAVLGMVVLNESRPFPKKLGIAAVFGGLVLVGLG